MGRKRIGNVLFARRVRPELVPRLLELIKEGKASGSLIEGGTLDEPSGPDEITELKAQITSLLDDTDKKTKEVDHWKARFEKCVQATEHQMAVYWKDRANKAEAAGKQKSEFDQT